LATSGSSDFNQTRNEIISNSLSLLGVLAAGETAQTADINFCSGILNMMVKSWVAQGIHLWTEESGTIFLEQGQPQYNLESGVNGAKSSDGSNTVETTLASSVSSSATIEVSSTTFNLASMEVGDVIGVAADDETFTWSTIASISGNFVTLNDTISNASASGNSVYSYTTQLPRVLSIQSARYRNPQNFDRVMEVKAREDYMRIPQKDLQGSPIILYYSPQVSNGQVYVWPAPNTINGTIEVTYLRTIQDFDSASDNPDFPQEWIEAIVYNLAVRLAPAYGINLNSGGVGGNSELRMMANEFLNEMRAWDSEQPFVQIVPKNQYFPK